VTQLRAVEGVEAAGDGEDGEGERGVGKEDELGRNQHGV